jgi:hypothetical protein
VLFNEHDNGLVLRPRPGGEPMVMARVPGKLAGLAPLPPEDGALLASGWAADGTPAVFRVGAGGAVAELLRPRGAAFLNGFTHLRGARYLLADSARGLVWRWTRSVRRPSPGSSTRCRPAARRTAAAPASMG